VNRFGSPPPPRRELAEEERYRLPRGRREKGLYRASSVWITQAQKIWLKEYGGGNISEGLRRLISGVEGSPASPNPADVAASMMKLEAIFNGAATATPPTQEPKSE
jgi:hypothetical protein